MNIKLTFFVLLLLGIYLKLSLNFATFNPLGWAHNQMGPVRIISGHQSYGSFAINQGVGGSPLTARGQSFQNGIGTHAVSRLTVTFEGTRRKLAGACIYPDYVSDGQIICSIYRGESILFRSQILDSKVRMQAFEVDAISGENYILGIDPANDSIYQAHGAWVNLE